MRVRKSQSSHGSWFLHDKPRRHYQIFNNFQPYVMFVPKEHSNFNSNVRGSNSNAQGNNFRNDNRNGDNMRYTTIMSRSTMKRAGLILGKNLNQYGGKNQLSNMQLIRRQHQENVIRSLSEITTEREQPSKLQHQRQQ